jgi:hypothetical protein
LNADGRRAERHVEAPAPPAAPVDLDSDAAVDMRQQVDLVFVDAQQIHHVSVRR